METLDNRVGDLRRLCRKANRPPPGADEEAPRRSGFTSGWCRVRLYNFMIKLKFLHESGFGTGDLR